MEEKILAALAEPAKAGDVATKLGEDKTEVAKVIKKLQKEGKVVSPKMCFYQAVK
jgi:DNA-binding MarR family transcriptional regulator